MSWDCRDGHITGLGVGVLYPCMELFRGLHVLSTPALHCEPNNPDETCQAQPYNFLWSGLKDHPWDFDLELDSSLPQ